MGKIKSIFLSRSLGILPVLVILFFILYLCEPNIGTAKNIVTIFRNSSINIVIACGMTLVILVAGIDLSVGSILAVSAVGGLAVSLIPTDSYLAVPITLGIGAFAGLLNGLLIAGMGLPPFIATLGTMSSLRGLAYILAKGQTISNPSLSYKWIGRNVPSEYFGNLIKMPIPYMVIIAVIVVIAIHLLLTRTNFGLRIFAIGGNKQAAQLTGIKVKKNLIFVYLICGFLAGLAALMASSRLESANGQMGLTYELDAIAAVVLGGTSMSGGVGSVIGTMFGALMIGVLNNSFTLLNISYFWQMVVKGIVIILAVSLDILRTKASRRL